MSDRIEVTITVNGRDYRRQVEPRVHLADFLRNLLQRVQCTEQEVRTLHGVITAFAGPRGLRGHRHGKGGPLSTRFRSPASLLRASDIHGAQEIFRSSRCSPCMWIP